MNAETKSLKKRVVTSGVWVLVGHFLSQLIRLGGNLILTRLLIPEMFGVMALANVIQMGLAMFTDFGILQNIVQSKKGEDPIFLNTAWTIQIFRSLWIVLLILLFSICLYQANRLELIPQTMVYANRDLPFLLVLMSAGTLISGFNSIHLTLLNRRLMLKKSILMDVSSQLTGLLAIIYFAWKEHSVFALAIGGIVSSAVKMSLSHLLIAERCRFAWDKEAVNDIVHFGKWIMLSTILTFLLVQGDRLLLGAFISPEQLGVYSIAFFLANAVKDVLSKLISSIFYPALSDILRTKPERFENIYYKIRHRIDALAMFSAGFLYSSSGKIIDLLYDDRYQNAGWMMQILSLSLIGTGFMLSGQCFIAHGKSKLITILAGTQLISLYSLVPLAFYFYDLEYAIWCIALNPLIRVVVSQILMKKYFFLNVKKEFICIPFIAIGLLLGDILNMLLSEEYKHIWL